MLITQDSGLKRMRTKLLLAPWLLLSAFVLAACGGGGSTPPGGGGGVDPPPPPPPPTSLAGLNTISETDWDETAVRKVLQIFAYGGQATDTQVTAWADMPPGDAIQQMLTFDEHNLRLSPMATGDLDGLDTRQATLRGLVNFWTSDDPNNNVLPELRSLFTFAPLAWYKATMSRGLNPFRQKIGLFETNYHMSVNQQVGVTSDQVIAYYDGIMSQLASGRPYQEVVSNAALSAAVARQYGHFTNVYVDGTCFCNEDFAREYHQLFFGILGEYDPNYHETVAIKNTAAALTDIRLEFDTNMMDFVDFVEFGTEFHTPGPLDILNVQIGGFDAQQRIDQLSGVAIEHPESLANLPVVFVSGLADDNLTDAKIQRIRQAWGDMAQKDLLRFLRAYAVSDLFHSSDRIKYFTSVDRHFLIANQVSHSNTEVNSELYTPFDGLADEDVLVFSPRYNVFGAQTSTDAAESASVFRSSHNRLTREADRYRIPAIDTPDITFTKDWTRVMSAAATNNYRVDGVAEWLWQRFIADGQKNLGPLERAHTYAFLAFDTDLVYAVTRDELVAAGQDPDDLSLYDFDRIITEEDLATDADLQAFVDNMASMQVDLNVSDTDLRTAANVRVGSAVNFIVATPYMFAQEGL